MSSFIWEATENNNTFMYTFYIASFEVIVQFIVDALFNIVDKGSVPFVTLTTRVPVHCLHCVMGSHTVQIIYNRECGYQNILNV